MNDNDFGLFRVDADGNKHSLEGWGVVHTVNDAGEIVKSEWIDLTSINES